VEHERLFAEHPIVKKFHQAAPVNRVELFGDPSDDLQELFPKLEPYRHWGGFTR
jgi:hypothetical protein